MSYLSENVIPGKKGKVFGTNAKREQDLERIKRAILSVEGVSAVDIDPETFPIEIIVRTDHVVEVKDIENKVSFTGFHVKPKGFLEI